ncbi:hypothetical protein BJ944DRAFT_245306 [Cunninghamella echinulata]|nr:hypothetical protein BJ944DRAFT_245306 [Cunninghamella echinulata]
MLIQLLYFLTIIASSLGCQFLYNDSAFNIKQLDKKTIVLQSLTNQSSWIYHSSFYNEPIVLSCHLMNHHPHHVMILLLTNNTHQLVYFNFKNHQWSTSSLGLPSSNDNSQKNTKLIILCSISGCLIFISSLVLFYYIHQYKKKKEKRQQQKDITIMEHNSIQSSILSLSFLNHDNAMIWSKHVHQLLAMIHFQQQQQQEQESSSFATIYPSIIQSSPSIISSSSSSLSFILNNNGHYSNLSNPPPHSTLNIQLPLPVNIQLEDRPKKKKKLIWKK